MMRIDVFLKACRLVKRRSVAKDYCDAGRVKICGTSLKPGREVKAGDVISLRLPKRRIVVEIVEIPKGNVPKERAAELYRIIEDVAQVESL